MLDFDKFPSIQYWPRYNLDKAFDGKIRFTRYKIFHCDGMYSNAHIND